MADEVRVAYSWAEASFTAFQMEPRFEQGSHERLRSVTFLHVRGTFGIPLSEFCVYDADGNLLGLSVTTDTGGRFVIPMMVAPNGSVSRAWP